MTKTKFSYNQAAATAMAGQIRLESLNVGYFRPDDYFAEMIKSDTHMRRVRAKLLQHKQRIEASEERRKQREQKLYGKRIRAEKLQEKAKLRREQMNSLKDLRKGNPPPQ